MIPIKLPKEQKDEIVKSLKTYFEDERAEALGDLGAEQIIDFMIIELGPYIYNKALGDARILINRNAVQIEEELYSMEKPIRKR